jgi:hypothetical protein
MRQQGLKTQEGAGLSYLCLACVKESVLQFFYIIFQKKARFAMYVSGWKRQAKV